MKKSELLQAAIDKYLWDGNPGTYDFLHSRRCLCHCVGEYSKDATAEEIKKIIHARIYPYTTVTNWLAQGVKIPSHALTLIYVQAYRKRWAESLIEEFKAQGD